MNVNGITLTAYQQQQLHAHQMAILQNILDEQNVGLIRKEEENEERAQAGLQVQQAKQQQHQRPALKQMKIN